MTTFMSLHCQFAYLLFYGVKLVLTTGFSDALMPYWPTQCYLVKRSSR